MSNGLYLISFGFLLGLTGAAEAACTVPNQVANGSVVDSAPVTADFGAVVSCLANGAPSGSENSIQLNNGTGGFAAVGPLSDGQTIIGSSGAAPIANTLTAGTGIAIANSPGGIAISTTGEIGGGGADWLNGAAVVKPSAANFILRTSTTPPTGAAIANSARGMLLSTSAGLDGSAMMAEMDAPSGHWQATMLGVYTGPLSDWTLPSIAVRDAVNNKSVEFGMGANGQTAYRFDYFIRNGGIGLDNRVNDIPNQDVGFPQPAQPIWQRLTYDGTNLIWSFSRDGEFYIPAYSVAASSALTNLNKIGPAVIFAQGIRQTWPAYFQVLSWSVSGI